MASIRKISQTITKLKLDQNIWQKPLMRPNEVTNRNIENRRDFSSMARMAFNYSGYNRYGLYTDDVISHDFIFIKEALRRLPIDDLDKRNYRMIRAMQLNYNKIMLPEEEWITYEQDVAYRYLTPYLEEVRAEYQEIYNFGCPNYSSLDWPFLEHGVLSIQSDAAIPFFCGTLRDNAALIIGRTDPSG
ncbi:uncharacterized protein [Prorops nasuta]|uniref:uncharacterized protein n=1 Tax=Prorops nasuta TaxID=863751 RepID=UPI0034CD2B60